MAASVSRAGARWFCGVASECELLLLWLLLAPSLSEITGLKEVCGQYLLKTERDLSGCSGENLAGKLRFDSAAGGWDPRMCILASSR